MPPKKNLKLSAARLRRFFELFSQKKGGVPRLLVHQLAERNVFGLIQEFCKNLIYFEFLILYFHEKTN